MWLSKYNKDKFYEIFTEIRNELKLLSKYDEGEISVLDETNNEKFWIHYQNVDAWVTELLSLYECQEAKTFKIYCSRHSWVHEYGD